MSMAFTRCKHCARISELFSPAPLAPAKWYRRVCVMFWKFSALVAAVALGWSVELAADRSQAQRPREISVTPSMLRPGDVARVDVSGVDGEEISGTVLGQALVFHYDEQEQKWRALVGIDLDTTPGTYHLRLDTDAAPADAGTIRVVPRTFRVRRLTVPGGFVNPPPETLAQIARDSALLADVYARGTPRVWSGPFMLPVDRRASSNFGTRSYYNGEARSPHAGVDFAAASGTPVRAANYGRVVVSGPMYFTGNTIVVDYGDRLFSIFAHLSELRANVGDTVEPTTVVGLVGATGRVTGPHLHWSVRLNGARVDPLSLVAVTANAER
jgi:murein DD-endopeptidase MepM/ murein hydrolase activator NlpD